MKYTSLFRKQHVSSGDLCDSIKHVDGVTIFLLEVHKPLEINVDPLECFVTATNHADEMVTDSYLKYTNLLGIFLSHWFFVTA